VDQKAIHRTPSGGSLLFIDRHGRPAHIENDQVVGGPRHVPAGPLENPIPGILQNEAFDIGLSLHEEDAGQTLRMSSAVDDRGKGMPGADGQALGDRDIFLKINPVFDLDDIPILGGIDGGFEGDLVVRDAEDSSLKTGAEDSQGDDPRSDYSQRTLNGLPRASAIQHSPAPDEKRASF
jgi:hypothetical protein